MGEHGRRDSGRSEGVYRIALRKWHRRGYARGRDDEVAYFTSGQPESFAAGNALSPGTTASCL